MKYKFFLAFPLVLVIYVIYKKITKQSLIKQIEKAKISLGENNVAKLDYQVEVFYKDIKGVTLLPWQRNKDIWMQVAGLDSESLMVFNAIWTAKYALIFNETLYKSVKGEKIGNVNAYKQLILDKLISLNLK